jgi:H+/Cl- antiporter ClcA
MNFFKRMLIVVLILSVISLYFPKIVLAGQGLLFAEAATTTGITEHTPEILAPPEEDIPVEKVAKEEKKTWLWALLGVAAIGALAAGGGGGGGGGGAPPPGTGDVTVGW